MATAAPPTSFSAASESAPNGAPPKSVSFAPGFTSAEIPKRVELAAVSNLVSNAGSLMDGQSSSSLLRFFPNFVRQSSKGEHPGAQESGYLNVKHSPFMVSFAPVVPSCNLRKAVRLCPEKDTGYKRFNFEGGVRIVESSEGPVISQATVAAGWRQTVAITDFGRIRARFNMYKRLGFHGVVLSPEMAQGVNVSLFSDFDETKVGNFELTQKQFAYQRAVPAYVGGPFKGAGATLKLGVTTPYPAIKPVPTVGVEKIKIVITPALAATAAVVVAAFLAVKPPLGFKVALPLPAKVPLLDIQNRTSLGVKLRAVKEESSGKKKVGVSLFDLASFQWTLPNYER